MGSLLYQLFRYLFAFIFRVIFRTTIIGRERVPAVGPVLLVSNHLSLADPPLVGVASLRPVEFMAMVELFHRPVLAWFVKAVGCIPVDRTKVDHRAAREAVRRLRAGHCIGIFPEGGIRLGEQSVLGGNPTLRAGVETIALLGRAAIVPVIVNDSRKPYAWRNWFHRESMSVTFGQPFCLWHPQSSRDTATLHETVRCELLKTVALQ